MKKYDCGSSGKEKDAIMPNKSGSKEKSAGAPVPTDRSGDSSAFVNDSITELERVKAPLKRMKSEFNSPLAMVRHMFYSIRTAIKNRISISKDK